MCLLLKGKYERDWCNSVSWLALLWTNVVYLQKLDKCTQCPVTDGCRIIRFSWPWIKCVPYADLWLILGGLESFIQTVQFSRKISCKALELDRCIWYRLIDTFWHFGSISGLLQRKNSAERRRSRKGERRKNYAWLKNWRRRKRSDSREWLRWRKSGGEKRRSRWKQICKRLVCILSCHLLMIE